MVDTWGVSSDIDLWMKRRGTRVFRLIPAPPPPPPPSREKAAAGILPFLQNRDYGTRPGLFKLYCSVCCGVEVALQCLLRCSSCTAVSVAVFKLYCSVFCGVQVAMQCLLRCSSCTAASVAVFKLHCSVCCGVQVVLQCLLRCSSCTAVSVAVFKLYCSVCCGRTGRVVLRRLLWPDWAGCSPTSVVAGLGGLYRKVCCG